MDRFHKNVAGDFYTENLCLSCEAPYGEAPDLIGTDDGEGGYHCYFRRQPQTKEEVENAINACVASCIGCVRYAGKDPEILHRFRELGGTDACDVLSEPDDS